MVRYLFVLSYDDVTRFDAVHERLAGNPHVEVLLDRRYRERRRRDEPPSIERRCSDRRRHEHDATLQALGWALVRRA